MKLRRVVAGIAVLLALMVGSGVLLWRHLSQHPDRVADVIGFCGNINVQDYPGPGRYKAFVYTRDCGATTGWTTHVAIAEHAARKPVGIGNAFIAGWRLGARPEGYAGGPPVRVEWRSGRQLVITYDARIRPPFMPGRVDSVEITYVAASEPIGAGTQTP
ncbi:MAG TPA: hypothetical protein VF158_11045 [Longimicrobiales bacterium]